MQPCTFMMGTARPQAVVGGWCWLGGGPCCATAQTPVFVCALLLPYWQPVVQIVHDAEAHTRQGMEGRRHGG